MGSKYLGLVFCLIGIGIGIFFFSQRYVPSSGPVLEIAVVDLNKIVSELESMQKFKNSLNKIFQKYQEKFQKKEDRLRIEYQSLLDMEQSFQSKDPKASQSLERKRQLFQEKALETQKEAELYQQKLNDFHHKSLEQFNKDVEIKVKNFSQKHKIKLLLPKDKTLYVESYIDLTQALADELSSLQMPVFKGEQ